MLSIIYNNQDSNKIYGLYLENIPTFPSLNAIYETTDLSGRDGSLNIFDKYPDLEIKIDFILICSRKEILNKKSRIIAWLNSSSNKELYYSEDSSVFYNVKKINITDFNPEGSKVWKFSATFTIEPFLYLLEGKEVIEITKSTTIYSGKATYNSKPYIKIYGNGDINLAINNRVTVFKSIDGFIEIDSKEMNCYRNIDGVIKNYNNLMYSYSFPFLDPGENNISWSGNVNKIEIIPRWCCL